MSLDRDEMLQRVQRYLVGMSELEGDPTPIGPFTVYVSRVTTADWGTYAMPAGELNGNWRDDLDRVEAVFRQHGRRGSVDWLLDLYPELRGEVESRGFTEVEVEPLLVLDEPARLLASSDVSVERIQPDDDSLGQILENVRIAFEETSETTDVAVAERREMLKADHRVMVKAVEDGEPVGSGSVTFIGGTAEITGIATRASHRGRGIASAVTSELARAALDAGCDVVYLTARDDAAARIYTRLGFSKVGTYVEAGKPKE